MSRRVAVLRPEPGNRRSITTLRAMGIEPISLPLFEIASIAWDVPPLCDHDAILFTSANSLRFGGEGLNRLHSLPALAVGAATGSAAQAAGFALHHCGSGNADDLLRDASALGFSRLLHLGGEDTTIDVGETITRSITVYASRALPIDPARLTNLVDSVVLLHSARAANRFAELVVAGGHSRSDFRIAAMSHAVAETAGNGWAARQVADTPEEAALLAQAAKLAD